MMVFPIGVQRKPGSSFCRTFIILCYNKSIRSKLLSFLVFLDENVIYNSFLRTQINMHCMRRYTKQDSIPRVK